MKVLHILDTCNRGGAETLVLDICRNSGLSQSEILFATFQGGTLFPQFQQSGIRTFRLGRNLPLDPMTLRNLHRLLISERIDIIHTHLASDMVHAQLAKFHTNAIHIHTNHGYRFDSARKDRLAYNLLARYVDSHIFVSCPQRDYYLNEGFAPHRSFVVENGIDIQKYQAPEMTNLNLRNELGINDSAPLMAMVGNFVNNVRDQMTVCKALNILRQMGSNFQFLFIGRKSDSFPALFDDCVNFCNQMQLTDYVKFIGARPDIPHILPQLDLFVYSSNHDTFGIAVVEAMIAGIPVIANDIGPFQIISEYGRHATIYPTKNEYLLAESIHRFIADPQSYIEKAKIAKAYAQDKYGISRVISELDCVYKKSLS